MIKPTKEEVVAAARVIADRMAERLSAYVVSVRHGAQHYDELPDEDDFLAWVEGWDWSVPE